jgi:uncharacterized protein YuzE
MMMIRIVTMLIVLLRVRNAVPQLHPQEGGGSNFLIWKTTTSVDNFEVTVSDKFAYYDRDADIAWLPTRSSNEIVSEEVEWGLIDHDAASDAVVAIKIWSASQRLPAEVLASLPDPAGTSGAAA